ncbi:unnamed protein product, partial [Leptidea sinapis]
MIIAGKLPKIQRFCYCTRNLKCACFIVIFIGMFSSIQKAELLAKPICNELYISSSPVRLIVNILRWLLFTEELILSTSCFVFLLGIFM